MLRRAGALFIVNDHADIARAVDADGVHLGQDDLPVADARKVMGPRGLIGLSTHDRQQAAAAQAAGADYIGFGPLFPTRTKDAGPARGTPDLAAVTASVTIPVIAIGGITAANAAEAMSRGPAGIAVISAVLGADDMRQAVRQFIDQMQSSHRGVGP
jgi:thiamine-phosphate pyrophosphorylase